MRQPIHYKDVFPVHPPVLIRVCPRCGAVVDEAGAIYCPGCEILVSNDERDTRARYDRHQTTLGGVP
jgi:uncharacterized Zn finger protein (UPF0148 family)